MRKSRSRNTMVSYIDEARILLATVMNTREYNVSVCSYQLLPRDLTRHSPPEETP